MSLKISVKLETAWTHSQSDFAAKLIFTISDGINNGFSAIFFLILFLVAGVIFSPFKFFNLFNNPASDRTCFLIWSQSDFSSNNIATHSTVYLTKACGLLFYFISPISPLFNLSNYSTAFYNIG